MKVLKKRTVTFRPDSSVKAMLAEVDSLISALELQTSLEDVINAALQSYLPPLIKQLRMTAESEDVRAKTLARAEAVLREEQRSDV